MTTLRLLADLLLIAPRIAWAWLKTKMPSAPALVRFCCGCGWALTRTETNLLCNACQDDVRQLAAVSKLFCCGGDLEYQVTRHASASATTTRVYRCPRCNRVWLYITDWANDANSVSDWYPQMIEADGGELPDLFDERTRTKVYC